MNVNLFVKLVNISIISLILLLSHNLYAQESAAKQTLRERLAQYQTFSAEFDQVISDKQGEVLQETSGSITLKKPQKLKWQVNSPEQSLLIADGETVFNIDPFVEQVTLMDQASLTQDNPLMLLISDEDSQWKSVNVSQMDTGQFLLEASSDKATIVSVRLHFDDNNNLTEVISLDKQQQQNLIQFSEVKLNLDVANSAFTYQADPSWVIDDQRTIN